MKAKELIEILQKNPEAEVEVSVAFDEENPHLRVFADFLVEAIEQNGKIVLCLDGVLNEDYEEG